MKSDSGFGSGVLLQMEEMFPGVEITECLCQGHNFIEHMECVRYIRSTNVLPRLALRNLQGRPAMEPSKRGAKGVDELGPTGLTSYGAL